MLFSGPGGVEEFFKVSYTHTKSLGSISSGFFGGLIIFVFGLYDIIKSIYAFLTLKHKKKQPYDIKAKTNTNTTETNASS